MADAIRSPKEEHPLLQVLHEGCGTNRNANTLNKWFADLLNVFTLEDMPGVLHLIKQQTIATYNHHIQENKDEYAALQQQHADLNRKIERLEERYIDEDLTRDLYMKYAEKYKQEKYEIEEVLVKALGGVSNLEECIEKAIEFAVSMPKKWLSADYGTKQRLQFLIFPEGITYNRENDGCRTPRINSVFVFFAYCKQQMAKMKRGIPKLYLDYASLSSWVAPIGLNMNHFIKELGLLV